jgi:hypothetical protein
MADVCQNTQILVLVKEFSKNGGGNSYILYEDDLAHISLTSPGFFPYF